MPKFIQLARSYFNDKDIEDLLGNPRFSQRLLLQVARDRGIFLSPDEKRETIIGYLSLQYFDWHARNALTARLDKDDPDERRATVCIEKVASIDAIEKATEKAKDILEKERQVIRVKKVNGRLVINGTYVDIDPTASKGVQRQQKNFSAEFEVDKGMIKVEYTHSAKATNLINGIFQQLKGEESTKDVVIRRISLAGIKDPLARTNFL